MSNNRRFAIDERGYVIDVVNPANSGKGYYNGGPEDDRHLRERVLIVRLGEMIDKLIEKLPLGGECKPFLNDSLPLLYVIRASHLNTLDPMVSIQHKFDGKLGRHRKHTQDFTSLGFFRDDFECLLRDLYGDVKSEALDSIVYAVFRTVEAFTRYVRPDLWKEHSDAEDFDYMFGVGVPEGYGIQSSDWHRGMGAKVNLFRRAREVNDNPSNFSEYTREFAKLFAERWNTEEHEWETEWKP
jgi:hypothetical protein